MTGELEAPPNAFSIYGFSNKVNPTVKVSFNEEEPEGPPPTINFDTGAWRAIGFDMCGCEGDGGSNVMTTGLGIPIPDGIDVGGRQTGTTASYQNETGEGNNNAVVTGKMLLSEEKFWPDSNDDGMWGESLDTDEFYAEIYVISISNTTAKVAVRIAGSASSDDAAGQWAVRELEYTPNQGSSFQENSGSGGSEFEETPLWESSELSTTGANGVTHVFYPVNSSLGSVSGALKRVEMPDGLTYHVYYGNEPEEEEEEPTGYATSVRWSEDGKDYALLYDYGEDDELLSISYSIDETVVRSIEYEYYSGNVNIKNIITREGEAGVGAISNRQYFRYDVNDQLQLWLDGDQYERAIEEYGNVAGIESADFWTIGNEPDLVKYASGYYEYYNDGKVSKHISHGTGAGCTTCGATGIGEYTFEYETNLVTPVVTENDWAERTTTTRPDGTLEIVYRNAQYQVLLTEIRVATGEYTYDSTVTWNRYYEGSVVMTAHHSAFKAVNGDLYDEDFSDLVGYDPETGTATHLHDDKGRIDVFAVIVDAALPIDEALEEEIYLVPVTDPRQSVGRVAATYVQTGTNRDEAVKLREWTYQQRGTVVTVATMTDYSGGEGYDATVTSYEILDYYRDDNFAFGEELSDDNDIPETAVSVMRRVTRLAKVSGAQNGADADLTGSSEIYVLEEVFDRHGRVVWSHDAQGHLTYFEYDPVSGVMTKRIRDLDTTKTADYSAALMPGDNPHTEPTETPWVRTGGAHLITVREVDYRGRVVFESDESGKQTHWIYDESAIASDGLRITRVYGGWDDKVILAGGSGSGDVAVVRLYGGAGVEGMTWFEQDANFNVTSLTDGEGNVLERYSYTSYGVRSVHEVDFTLKTNPAESDYGNEYGHQGGRQELNTGLIQFRYRWYHVTLGLWPARDPANYIEWANLYQYCRSNPIVRVDPSGLASAEPATQPATQPTTKPCKCCCVDSLIAEEKRQYTPDKDKVRRVPIQGHQVDVTISRSFINFDGGDCSVEWWEKSNRMTDDELRKGGKPGEWHDAYQFYPDSPGFRQWNDGESPAVITDQPLQSLGLGERKLEIVVIARSGKGCPCPKSEVSVYIVQHLGDFWQLDSLRIHDVEWK